MGLSDKKERAISRREFKQQLELIRHDIEIVRIEVKNITELFNRRLVKAERQLGIRLREKAPSLAPDLNNPEILEQHSKDVMGYLYDHYRNPRNANPRKMVWFTDNIINQKRNWDKKTYIRKICDLLMEQGKMKGWRYKHGSELFWYYLPVEVPSGIELPVDLRVLEDLAERREQRYRERFPHLY